MRIKVWHKTNPNFGYPTPERPNTIWPDGYTIAAYVMVPDDAEALDQVEIAFGLTNSVDYPWYENRETIPVRMPCRSTSVGDIVEIGDRVFEIQDFGVVEIIKILGKSED